MREVRRNSKSQLERCKIERRRLYEGKKRAEEKLLMEREVAAKFATHAKIRFSFQDGSTVVNEFPAECILADLYTFVKEWMISVWRD